MDPYAGEPAHQLHALVSRLDRRADQRLREHGDLTYQRFLALLTARRLAEAGPVTQRALADRLGMTEAGASRLVGSLREAGWLDVRHEPGTGNRRSLALTTAGSDQVDHALKLLEGSFAALLDAAGVTTEELTGPVGRLLAVMDAPAGPGPRPATATGAGR